MKLTLAVQESLICLLCYDKDPQGGRMVRSLVPVNCYDPYYRDIAEKAIEYLDKYHEVPGEHTLDLIDVIKSGQKEDAGEIFDRIFRSMEQTRDGINRRHVMAQATLFVRYQNIIIYTNNALDLIQDPTEQSILEAEATLTKLSKATVSLFDSGTKFWDTDKSLRFLDAAEEDQFLAGVTELDRLGLGPARRRFHLFLGLYGKGKSRWLTQLGKMALLSRKKVLYVSLELGEEEVAQRFAQSLFSISKRKEEHSYRTFDLDDMGKIVGFHEQRVEERPALSDPKIRGHLIRKIQRKHLPLMIKQFPTGSLTTRELKAYLDALEGVEAFIPDLILIDYPDLMDIDPKHERESLSRLYKELRGLAIERNVAVAAVSQINREGEGTKTVGGRHVTGDFSKMAIADVVMTYNQTEAEHELGLARLYVAKGRTDQDRFTILLSQMYGLGQFCMESVRMSKSTYWKALDEATGHGDDEDE